MAVRHINPVSVHAADGIVKELYAQIKRDFGAVAEPFLIHSPLPQLLAAVWSACRETELTGMVPRSVKEVIATAVSGVNLCPYCVDAHTIMLKAVGEHKVADSLTAGATSLIADPRLRAVAQWSSSTLSPESAIVLSPPFSLREAPEFIGMAVLYHYINRMVTVFLSETPLPLNRAWLKGALKRIAALYFSFSARRLRKAGESLNLPRARQLPSDLLWAKHSPHVASAFAQLEEVIENIGRGILADAVRERIVLFVEGWGGKQPGVSKDWVEEAIAGLNDESRAVGRLVLTSAIAPYQVDEHMITRFLDHYPRDTALIGALAWGSFTAARKIGTWLYRPFPARDF